MGIKIKKKKFIRNIIIVIIALIIVAFIVNTAPGFKRNKYQNVINLIIGDKNVTDTLKKPIYKDETGEIYISKEDIKELLDKTLYYDEENKMIIATSEVATASMKIGEKNININGAKQDTLHTAIEKENTIYIPIHEFKTVYNLELKHLEDEQIVIIDKLNEGKVKAEIYKKTEMKLKPRALSKNIKELEAGNTVTAFYTTSKGWRLIRTEDGVLGYVKANVLTNEYIVRQDMNQKTRTETITTSVEDGTKLSINDKNVIIKDLLKLTEEGILIKNTDISNMPESCEIWANLDIEEVNLKEFSNRINLIKNIKSIAMKNNIKGINVILNGNKETIERFVIELKPQLNEIGIYTNIVVTEDIETDKYLDIVNYIIKK